MILMDKNKSSTKKGVGMKEEKTIYQRIIVKLTGESFAREGDPISLSAASFIANELAQVHVLGVGIGVVVGGGNIVRGATLSKDGRIESTTADHMGMLATVINALSLSSILREHSIETRVQTAIEMRAIAEPTIRDRALRHLEKGRIVIYACGTGNPKFTTDTAAVLRASEVHADAIIKATKVNGIYTDDPEKNRNAVLIPEITYEEVFERRLKFIDAAAVGLAMETYRKPIHVVNIFTKGNLVRVLKGEKIGSRVS